MELIMDNLLDCGAGHFPQAVHDINNKLCIFSLTDNGTISCAETDPPMGIYDNLVFKNRGRCSPDENISLPSIKKVAHFGAYGFWSAESDHRFIIYMVPTDISRAFVNGSVQIGIGSEVSSLSCNLINIQGQLLNRYRALVTPGTRLEIHFSLGNSPDLTLGIFYIDRANVAYPEETVSVSGRNAIGKLLKEQTFDETTSFDTGSLQGNLKAILEYAGVENFFVGDNTDNKPLNFESETTILEGLKYAYSMIDGWQLAETSSGVVGISAVDDARFDRPSVFAFERDHTCWNYNIEYDDSDAASRVCVWSQLTGEGQENQTRRVYVDVQYNRWWVQPMHRTLYVQTIDDATDEQINHIATSLAKSLEITGRIETFACIFTPQLTLGDEVHITNSRGASETIGTVTDVKHTFGKGGFFTSFTVDSGGRRSRARLSDLIASASENPKAFTGIST